MWVFGLILCGVLHGKLQPLDKVAEMMSLSPMRIHDDAADPNSEAKKRLRFASKAPTPPKTESEKENPNLMNSTATCPEVVPQGGCCAIEGRIGVMPNMQNCNGHGQCLEKQAKATDTVAFLEVAEELQGLSELISEGSSSSSSAPTQSMWSSRWSSRFASVAAGGTDASSGSSGVTLGNCKKTTSFTCQKGGDCISDPANPCPGGCKCNTGGMVNKCKCQAEKKKKKPTGPQNYTVHLTSDQQLESLGSRAPEYMDATAPPTCDLNLKTEISVSKCNLATYGCVVGSDGAEMWVKLKCAGLFSLGGKDLECEGPSKDYHTCNLLQEYFCEPGQGPPDRSFNSSVASGPVVCAETCEDTIDCVAFDYARGIKDKKENCRLYDENKQGMPQTGLKENSGGLADWKYCLVPPMKRKNACGTAGVCAECQCMAGWAGYGCEINLAESGGACLPMMPGCDTGETAAPPCFGEAPDFPEDHPCRSPFRIHVPYPPEQPPTVAGGEGGLAPSWEESPYPAAWTPASGGEGGE